MKLFHSKFYVTPRSWHDVLCLHVQFASRASVKTVSRQLVVRVSQYYAVFTPGLEDTYSIF